MVSMSGRGPMQQYTKQFWKDAAASWQHHARELEQQLRELKAKLQDLSK